MNNGSGDLHDDDEPPVEPIAAGIGTGIFMLVAVVSFPGWGPIAAGVLLARACWRGLVGKEEAG